MTSLDKKICVVTGAGGGIGSAICMKLADLGAAAVVAVEHREGSVDSWKNSNPGYDAVVPFCADLEDVQKVKSLVTEIKKHFGRIDILVNAAGIEFNESIGMIDHSHMEKMFSTNVIGLIEMLQYTSRVMMRQKSGSIVNIASVVGVQGNPGQAVYSATKGAVISFTKSAAKELAPYGIRVNAVAPGLTDTKMIRKASEESLRARVERISLKRMAKPEEIASSVAFLASDEAAFITGQILGVDGGTIM